MDSDGAHWSPSDEFDSTRETGSARAGDPPAAVPLPPPASPAHTHSANPANESLIDKTRYTRFKDQDGAPLCFLCLCQPDNDPSQDSIFGTPSEGIISRVTAYWQTH